MPRRESRALTLWALVCLLGILPNTMWGASITPHAHVQPGGAARLNASYPLAFQRVTAAASIAVARADDHKLALPRAIAGRLGRLAVYGALFMALGAVSVSAVIVPKLRRDDLRDGVAFARVLDGMALSAGVVAGFMLAAAIVLRTLLQYGDTVAEGAGLTMVEFLTATSVGRSLAASTILGSVVAVSAALARRARELRMWRSVQVAAVVLFVVFWTGSGHAAGERTLADIPANVPHVLHMLSAGLWVGTLGVIFITVLPLALRDPDHLPLLRATMRAFAPAAFVSAVVMVLTGALNSGAHFASAGELFTSAYGRALLVKLLLVATLIALAVLNRRVARDKLNSSQGATQLRSSVRLELLVALLILITTSIIVASLPPG